MSKSNNNFEQLSLIESQVIKEKLEKLIEKKYFKNKKSVKAVEEIDPLDTLYPLLFPDEYNEVICRSFKGKSDHQCRSFVVWDFIDDIETIKMKLFSLFIKDFKSLEYLSSELLVEYLEWIIDDLEDDFSFLSCMSANAAHEDISKLEIGYRFEISKVAAYDYVSQFLEEKRGILFYNLRKKEKQLATLESRKNKLTFFVNQELFTLNVLGAIKPKNMFEYSVLLLILTNTKNKLKKYYGEVTILQKQLNSYDVYVKQSSKNLAILDACLKTYFD